MHGEQRANAQMQIGPPLDVRSGFSFLEGASRPDELFATAAAQGWPALGVADRDGVYGLVRAHVAARAHGMRLLAGARLTLEHEAGGASTCLAWAADREGWATLCRLLTIAQRGGRKGEARLPTETLLSDNRGLVLLWTGEQSLPVLAVADPAAAAECDRLAGPLKDAFGDRLYLGVARHARPEDVGRERAVRTLAGQLKLPVVAAPEVLYHSAERRPLQDVLTCIRHRTTLADAGRLLRANDRFALPSPQDMQRRYADQPGWLAAGWSLSERLGFDFGQLDWRYPGEIGADGMLPRERLRRRVDEGAQRRYGGDPPADVRRQLEHELSVIDDLGYAGYFLTMADIVDRCNAQGILCQGRGSAANSAVCWCLGITAVDPVRSGLLFERFMSRERAEPPDIDLDIEHERREEVIRWVYERYGRDRAAMVANLVRWRSRSALREVGRVLGLPAEPIGRLVRLAGYRAPTPAEVTSVGFDPTAPALRHLLRLVDEMQDLPRHLSIHPGGFLLGQAPIDTLVPVEHATMPGRTVIQWDKDDIETLGLFKVDLLALGALTLLSGALNLLHKARGLLLTPATIPADDPATWAMIQAGDTVGTFQIESRAQMAMLPRLRPRCYYDLVIGISLVRPGPITGGMVHPYLRRRAGEEPVQYPHPSLEPVLARTLGVPLFQEQVMRLAVVAADYTPGEADQLRRDMAAWRQAGRIEDHRRRLIDRMTAKGIAPDFAERAFEQIRGFGDYGFPESHAAGFALIAWATAWLRCRYLDVFVCALLNAQPMGFYGVATILGDARRHGLTVRPMDVRHSDDGCTLEPLGPEDPPLPAQSTCDPPQAALRMGLRFLHGLSHKARRRIVQERQRAPFDALGDFVLRTRLEVDDLARLAEAGALDGFGLERREALWAVRSLAAWIPRGQAVLPLAPPESPVTLPPLGAAEAVCWDWRTSGHSTRGHPLAPLRAHLRRTGIADAATLRTARDGRRMRYAGLVICRQRPGTAGGIVFMTLEDETGLVNLIVRPNVYERDRTIARTQSFLGITGRLQNRHGVTHLIAEQLWIPTTNAPLHIPSRDFH